jgi:hypothetical protein
MAEITCKRVDQWYKDFDEGKMTLSELRTRGDMLEEEHARIEKTYKDMLNEKSRYGGGVIQVICNQCGRNGHTHLTCPQIHGDPDRERKQRIRDEYDMVMQSGKHYLTHYMEKHLAILRKHLEKDPSNVLLQDWVKEKEAAWKEFDDGRKNKIRQDLASKVNSAEHRVNDAERELTQAKCALTKAREKLSEWDASPVVPSPFSGTSLFQ